MAKNNGMNKGFTMAELLVVVAIIAVLVAIAIPVFSSQLEKSRQAVDLSNVRSAYALVQTSLMADEGPDGGERPQDGSIYYYTKSGTFKQWRLSEQIDTSSTYVLKANEVKLPDFISIDDRSGWKDRIIMVAYTDGKPSMYTWYAH